VLSQCSQKNQHQLYSTFSVYSFWCKCNYMVHCTVHVRSHHYEQTHWKDFKQLLLYYLGMCIQPLSYRLLYPVWFLLSSLPTLAQYFISCFTFYFTTYRHRTLLQCNVKPEAGMESKVTGTDGLVLYDVYLNPLFYACIQLTYLMTKVWKIQLLSPTFVL